MKKSKSIPDRLQRISLEIQAIYLELYRPEQGSDRKTIPAAPSRRTERLMEKYSKVSASYGCSPMGYGG